MTLRNRFLGAGVAFIVCLMFGPKVEAQVVINAMTGTQNFPYGVGGGANGNGIIKAAQKFTTSGSSVTLNQVAFQTAALDGNTNTFSLSVFSDSAGQPSTMVSNGSLSGTLAANSTNLWTASGAGILLNASTPYWLVFNGSTGTNLGVLVKAYTSGSATVAQGWSLTPSISSTTPSNSNWQTTSNQVLAVSISTIPEPATFAYLALGLLAIAGVCIGKRIPNRS